MEIILKNKEINLWDILSQFPWKTFLKNKFLKTFHSKKKKKEKRKTIEASNSSKICLVKKRGFDIDSGLKWTLSIFPSCMIFWQPAFPW